MSIHNHKCFSNHLGPWLAEPRWFCEALAAVKSGAWKLRPQNATKDETAATAQRNPEQVYHMTDGIAIITMSGPITKGQSKFDDTCSSLMTRLALRTASRDEKVNAIMLLIDSPGGMVAGTQELADDVRNINATGKPVYAHVDDLCASAAYWVGSQTKRMTANATAQIGSIGTLAVVVDSSKQYELMGLKVHVVSTGDLKGSFTDGTPVTEEHLEYLQGIVNGINEHFLKAVEDGRKMSSKDVKKVSTGQVWMAGEAKSIGLIDAVSSFDEALNAVLQKHGASIKAAKKSMRAEEVGIRIRTEEIRRFNCKKN